MKLHPVRPICRSHNPFSPSIALWQHFVLPYQTNPKLRLSSTVAQSIATSNPTVESDSPQTAHLTPVQLQNEGEGQNEASQASSVVERPPLNPGIEIRHYIARHKLSKEESLLSKTRTAVEKSKDYVGVVMNATSMKDGKSIPEQTLPWAIKYAHRGAKHVPAHERLNLEIAKFYEYAKPSTTEAIARKNVIEQVKEHTREILPEVTLEVFGSERTGTALATSDIDLRLIRANDFENARNSSPPSLQLRSGLWKDLHKLQREQFSKHEAYLMPTLRHARYPLISMQDRKTGLDIQVVLSNDTSVSAGIMQRYMHEFPNLRPVYSVVRTIFSMRGLSDVYHGGFGSYPIFMMLVASIIHTPDVEHDAASYLMNFLRFWAKFNTEQHAISIDPPVYFDKTKEPVMTGRTKARLTKGIQAPLPKYMLCLRDPADATNDLGRKGLCIKHVQATLRNLYRKLHSDMSSNTRASLLKPLVGDYYVLNRNMRAKREEPVHNVVNVTNTSVTNTAKTIRDGNLLDGNCLGETVQKPIH